MKYLNDLFKGKIGVVEKCIVDDSIDEESIVIGGEEVEVVTEVGDIDEFLDEKGIEGLVLIESDGYRGVGCYEGYMKKMEKCFGWMLIMIIWFMKLKK